MIIMERERERERDGNNYESGALSSFYVNPLTEWILPPAFFFYEKRIQRIPSSAEASVSIPSRKTTSDAICREFAW